MAVEDALVNSQIAPTGQGIQAAAKVIHGVANRTPVLTSRTLNSRVGCEVFLKCENFQRTGSFKFRGAYCALSRLHAEQRSRGVLTYSSGNHAQAISLAGSLLGIATTVVMPRSAPKAKRAATEGYGARVIDFDERKTVREEVAARLQERDGLHLIPPFDHKDVIEGQGTVGLELLDEVNGLDAVLVPCGGGGLLAGTALSAEGFEQSAIIGVEPDAADDAARTFRSGTVQRTVHPNTIADGLRTSSLGQLNWAVIEERVENIVSVSEEAIVEAMYFLWSRMKLIIEPSGAVALAALLRDPSAYGERVALVLTGGNVDMQVANKLFLNTKSRY